MRLPRLSGIRVDSPACLSVTAPDEAAEEAAGVERGTERGIWREREMQGETVGDRRRKKKQ